MNDQNPVHTPIPDRVLSFTIRGPWAHFRRVEGNIVKQTYRIIPRTTVAGLVAAVIGLPRDEYYHLFSPEESAVAISPVTALRTMNVPQNTLSTADGHIKEVPPRSRTLKIGLPDPSAPRQQHNYELLVDPAYRIDIWLKDKDMYNTLRDRLENGESYYTPSLGLSEHLCTIDYHGEKTVENITDGTDIEIDSAIPEQVNQVVVQPEHRYGIEQSPGYMTSDGRSRTTTGFLSVAYNPDGGPLVLKDGSFCQVNDRQVLFS